MPIRIATFNLENLDDGPNVDPPLAQRIEIMRPQLNRIRADILCLQEVHSQGPSGSRTLAALDMLLTGTDYANFNRETTTTMEGELYALRNLVTLSMFPVAGVQQIRDTDGRRPSYQMATAIPVDTTVNPVEWERPMLYTQLTLQSGATLHMINVHFKSKNASNIPGQKLDRYTWRTASAWAEGSFISAMKRVGQALQTRMLIDNIFDTNGEDSLIAICGDFNSEDDEVPVKTIAGHIEDTGNPAHATRLMVPCEYYIPDSSRYSFLYLGKGNMLDHVIASRGLLSFLQDAEIHNEALPDESGAFRQDTKFPESDHAPVVAEFGLD